MNAFIPWGSLEEHFKPPIKSVPLLKTPTKVIPALSESQVQHIVQFKPRWRKERRVHGLTNPNRQAMGYVLEDSLRELFSLHRQV